MRPSKTIRRVKSGLANTKSKSSRRVGVSLSGVPTGVAGVTFAIAVCSTRTEHRGFKRISGSFIEVFGRIAKRRVLECSLKRSFSVRATIMFNRLCGGNSR